MRSARQMHEIRLLRAAPGIVLGAALGFACAGCSSKSDAVGTAPTAAAAHADPDTIELRDSQLHAIKIGPVGTHGFVTERHAVGDIDFNEDAAVQVFAPYQGRILQAFAQVGDDVPRGKVLFTIDSPDLMQAESALIAAAGVLDLTKAALSRAEDLYKTEGIAQKDYQQALSDEMSAEAVLKAARESVRVFGKSPAEIDALIAQRKIDPVLVVVSPVSGRVTARFAQPGLLVQPGNAPAPYSVADMSTLWLIADVPERDAAELRVGQTVRATVDALGDREFDARIKVVGSVVDPNTHTVIVRSEVTDPGHELRSGMLARFIIQTGAPVESVSLPTAGIVREGDGTYSAWTTTDRRHFRRREVRLGMQADGIDQILDGLKAGDLAVTDGAILLSNILYGSGGDD